MKEKDKIAFKKYLSMRKNSVELLRLLKAFERFNLQQDAKGIIKRILIFRQGKDNRLYNKFKSHLFEYEVTSKRVDYFKNEDFHVFLSFELKKSFLAAQMMTERDAYLTSIHIMTETYRKAEKYEFIDVQKSCADNLSSYYFLTGNFISSEYWTKESKRLNKDLISYQSLHHIFEKDLQQIDCCEFHKTAHSGKILDRPISEGLKIKWMLEAINWKNNLEREQINTSFKKTVSLYREIVDNPGVYPRDFKILAVKFLFEDLYRLGKFSFLTKSGNKILMLSRIPIYHRIPLIDFFLFYSLKTRNYELLTYIFVCVNEEKSFAHFQPFSAHAVKIEILYLIVTNDERAALKKLNRNINVFKPCQFNDFDSRLLEMICLYRLKEWNVIEDKLESFRRFTFRNLNLRDSSYCLIMFNSIRSLILHNSLDNSILSIKQEKSVYDLRDFIAGIVMSLSLNNEYTSSEKKVSIAAEKEMIVIKKGNRTN